jgi:CheY-like chemotaxis protein
MTYRVTDAGRLAWESKDPAVPSDYRLILWLIDFHGSDHLERFFQNFPEQRLADYLAELKELRLVEEMGSVLPLAREQAPVFEISADELSDASRSLEEGGAYLALERRKGRPGKPLAETVVLIVEDDPDQLALADLRVSMAGYAVRVAPSQEVLAASLAKDGIPDLILLDVMLPDGNGFDILSKLRSMPAFAALPIVMLTAKNQRADVERGLRLGADGYITKPYSKNILASVIERILAPS